MSSEAAAEFLDRATLDHQTGDLVTLEAGDVREPMTLIVNPRTPDGDARLLFMRLEELGYEIDREYDGENQSAYTIYHPGYGGDLDE